MPSKADLTHLISMKILVIEDEAPIRDTLKDMLEIGGHDVITAVDGLEGLERLADHPELVLCDLNMPRLDGIGLTKKLRENPKFKTTPILILTTESSDQMKQAGRAAGATGWLVKPFDPAKLVEVIGKVIR